MIFIDTNVLVYAVLDQDDVRAAQAQDILADLNRTQNGVLSLQVLREFANVLTRKTTFPVAAVQKWVEAMSVFPCVGESKETIKRGLAIKARYGIHLYDALMVAAAEAAGCDTLYSEDMGDGQVYGGVRVINPFARDE